MGLRWCASGFPWRMLWDLHGVLGLQCDSQNTRSIRIFPKTHSLGILRHIPKQLVFPKGAPNTRSIRIVRLIPKKIVFPRGTKYPQYSYIQAQTKHFVSQGGKPNARSIRIFRNRPNTWYFRGGGTKYPQYSYIQAQTKQLPEYTNNVVFGVHPLA